MPCKTQHLPRWHSEEWCPASSWSVHSSAHSVTVCEVAECDGVSAELVGRGKINVIKVKWGKNINIQISENYFLGSCRQWKHSCICHQTWLAFHRTPSDITSEWIQLTDIATYRGSSLLLNWWLSHLAPGWECCRSWLRWCSDIITKIRHQKLENWIAMRQINKTTNST